MASLHSNFSHPKYRPDIDGLRAIAVLSVVAFHAFPEQVKAGFIGVDIFFVISGFLISSIIFENLQKGTFSFAEFYARRIRRIFPALVLVLITTYLLGWFTLFTDEYQRLGKQIAAGALFVSNFQLWHEAGYFDTSAEAKPLLHLWSLGIEEQFYIVWPLLLWLAWKRKFKLGAITVLVAVVSFYLNVKGVHQDAVATFYSPQTRFWELLCGSVLAWLTLQRNTRTAIIAPEREALLSSVLSTVGLVLLICGFGLINRDSNFPGLWAIFPVLGAVLIISAGPNAWFNRTILSNPGAVWFGLISFPLYLWHWPLLAFARIVEGEMPAAKIRITAVLLSVVLAWTTHKIIEKPLRFGGQKLAKLSVLILLMIGVGLAGYETYETDGLPNRMEQKSQTALRELIKNPLPQVEDINCTKLLPDFKGQEFDGGCRLSKNALPTVAFIGDSHMTHYRNAVWKQFSTEPVLMIVQTSCLPFSGEHFKYRDGCEKKYETVLHYLEKSPSVKTVVVSGYWSYLMAGGMTKKGNNWRTAQPLSAQEAQSFEANGVDFISRISHAGKEVIFMKDIPELDFDIQSCVDVPPPLRKQFMPERSATCSMKKAPFIERLAPYDAVIDEMLAKLPEIKIYNPRLIFCREDECFGSNGTLPYYLNGDHVNHYGAGMVIGDMRKTLNLGPVIEDPP